MVDEGDVFVSHDNVRLFTNTLIDEAPDIKNGLEQNNTLKDRTKLEVEEVMDLLRHILTTIPFHFNDYIYKQKFSTALGSQYPQL